MLLGAPGIATRSKDATTRNKDATRRFLAFDTGPEKNNFTGWTHLERLNLRTGEHGMDSGQALG